MKFLIFIILLGCTGMPIKDNQLEKERYTILEASKNQFLSCFISIPGHGDIKLSFKLFNTKPSRWSFSRVPGEKGIFYSKFELEGLPV